MVFTHDDYTVAWICALPLEMTAAKTMLDNVHSSLPQPETDHNVYTLGNITGHNVVIACLPSGVYGTTSAAVVLAHMLPTFPSLRFGLMVGIGGGVPSKNTDIRLGDVIVSMPTVVSGGVIQYDYGKTLYNGHLQRAGLLNKPPQYLLTAVSQIRSDYMVRDSLIKKGISEMVQKYQKIYEQFSRPDHDWLFKPGYDHTGKMADCSLCDQSQLVVRPTRESNEPAIHYGLIASGNQVIKNAKIRDSIAQELNILCFEMEAAGLMDQLPCLVIRGICDYCDSHKHKQWQGYAALTAAAYARALLEVVPPYNNDLSRKERGRWMVPFARNPRFVGRQNEINSLEQSILYSKCSTKTAICGLGGIGKTQIALELAYRVREKVPGTSIFWIPCTSFENVEQAYMNISLQLGIMNEKPAEAKEQVKVYLSQEGAGKWLLIFDNADDMDMWIPTPAGALVLRDFLPQSEQGHILFTTRNQKLAVKLASSHVMLVSEPDEETGIRILEKSLVRKTLRNSDATIPLLKWLAFLPLAIIQASSYINENCLDPSQYLKLLQDQESNVVELLSENFEDDGRYAETQNPVIATWVVSFTQIQQIDQLAADYLLLMACFDFHSIPESILPSSTSCKRKTDALGLLSAYSFINIQADDMLLTLHRLVYIAARNWMRNTSLFVPWIQRAATQLSVAFPNHDHKNRELWRKYMPHALCVMNEMDRQQKAQWEPLIWKMANCLCTDGRFNEAEELLIDLAGKQREATGALNPSTLVSMTNLASTYWNQGRWKEAEELHLRVMETRRLLFGPLHPSTLTSLANLASTYSKQARWGQAVELQAEVVTARKSILGAEHPNTLISVSNLASIYRSQGRYKEAEELETGVLEVYRRVMGPYHPCTLTNMANLASTYVSQGCWKKAAELQTEVLGLCLKTLGPEHPDSMTNMANLASIYWNQQRGEEAEALEIQVLETRRRVLGGQHPDTLTSMNNIAHTWKCLGKEDDAIFIMTECVRLRNRYLSPDHPYTISSAATLHDWQQNTCHRED
ncbi:violaceus kinesin [Aspergillus caelatus]|uniref:Violaceus kinesin n=1 Tax=Aspergillus caelatus TaxID=61420 RepID=A0A5N6ZTL3_9EURO|nr:violaceus kinesin [Aspergillus caelatus]KAE8360872.1 violaceus kinesin [Aspergillus caelatus]